MFKKFHMFKKYERGQGEVWFLICVLILIVLVFASSAILSYSSAQYVQGTIVDTKIDGGNTFFVFQPDGGGPREMLSNDDTLWFWKFNSNDFLMNIQVGKHYNLEVNWYRVPFLSMFRNILSYQETPAP
jgi:hypothetical protein